jgi:hypothetical protein
MKQWIIVCKFINSTKEKYIAFTDKDPISRIQDLIEDPDFKSLTVACEKEIT